MHELLVISDTYSCGDDEVLLDDVDVHPPHHGLGNLSDSRHIYVV